MSRPRPKRNATAARRAKIRKAAATARARAAAEKRRAAAAAAAAAAARRNERQQAPAGGARLLPTEPAVAASRATALEPDPGWLNGLTAALLAALLGASALLVMVVAVPRSWAYSSSHARSAVAGVRSELTLTGVALLVGLGGGLLIAVVVAA
ncbi:MAG: hypothetical protein ICV59_08385 [Thermoleophilia bacterium]|nr:hypothetical protein [Thermoleophilia bacterium]